MFQALRIAATGMNAQQTNVDVLSNNIANINTTAFKQSQPAFEDLTYQNKIAPGSVTSAAGTVAPTGLQVGLGVSIGASYRVMTQGTLSPTGGDFDVGISGRGFLKVSMPDGTDAYTRDGSLQIDQNGQLVTKEGYPIQPSVTVPAGATNYTVSATGQVSAQVNGATAQLGTLTLTMFTNEAGLQSIGDNKYVESDASGAPTDVAAGETGSGTFQQGSLESSNVDSVTTITQLITAQRAYEMNSRVISTADDMLSTLNQIR